VFRRSRVKPALRCDFRRKGHVLFWKTPITSRTPIRLFFTRNIQRPSAGIRLTGKGGTVLRRIDGPAMDRARGWRWPSFCPRAKSPASICSPDLFGCSLRRRSYFTIARVSRTFSRNRLWARSIPMGMSPRRASYNRVGRGRAAAVQRQLILEARAVTSSSTCRELNIYLSPPPTWKHLRVQPVSVSAGNLIQRAMQPLCRPRRQSLKSGATGCISITRYLPGRQSGIRDRAWIREPRGTFAESTIWPITVSARRGLALAGVRRWRQRYVFDHEGHRL